MIEESQRCVSSNSDENHKYLIIKHEQTMRDMIASATGLPYSVVFGTASVDDGSGVMDIYFKQRRKSAQSIIDKCVHMVVTFTRRRKKACKPRSKR